MAFKKEIKTNEARTLIYLSNVPVRHRFTRAISSKLGIDYSYMITTLKTMVCKGWVSEQRMTSKVYYHLAKKAPLKKAKKLLSEERKLAQRKLD